MKNARREENAELKALIRMMRVMIVLSMFILGFAFCESNRIGIYVRVLPLSFMIFDNTHVIMTMFMANILLPWWKLLLKLIHLMQTQIDLLRKLWKIYTCVSIFLNVFVDYWLSWKL